MLKKGVTDRNLRELMQMVKLEFLIEREGGFESVSIWKDKFSGGERQRMAIARMYYHCPKFAILDECTSAVSVDVEGSIYSQAKDLGITIVTVSHRPSLWKYHDYILKLDGEGGYSFNKLDHGEDSVQQSQKKKSDSEDE